MGQALPVTQGGVGGVCHFPAYGCDSSFLRANRRNGGTVPLKLPDPAVARAAALIRADSSNYEGYVTIYCGWIEKK